MHSIWLHSQDTPCAGLLLLLPEQSALTLEPSQWSWAGSPLCRQPKGSIIYYSCRLLKLFSKFSWTMSQFSLLYTCIYRKNEMHFSHISFSCTWGSAVPLIFNWAFNFLFLPDQICWSKRVFSPLMALFQQYFPEISEMPIPFFHYTGIVSEAAHWTFN